ncbi:NADP-dependent oxidoreductase [Sesbania bispinosa]|nr:NADP-dependent oxidoreductase [Sesbania bispinosa]
MGWHYKCSSYSSASGKLGAIITLTLHTQPPQGFLDLGTIASSSAFKKMEHNQS